MNHENLTIKTNDAYLQIRRDASYNEMTGRRSWRGKRGNFNPDSAYCESAMAEYLKQGGKITRLPGPKEKRSITYTRITTRWRHDV